MRNLNDWTAWSWRIVMALMLALLFIVADTSDKRVRNTNEATIEPCALVLTRESGPECR